MNAPPYVPGRPAPPDASFAKVLYHVKLTEWAMVAATAGGVGLWGFFGSNLRRRATGLSGVVVGGFGGFLLAYQNASGRVLGLPMGLSTGPESAWYSRKFDDVKKQ